MTLCPGSHAERLEREHATGDGDAVRPAPPALVGRCVDALAKLLGADETAKASWTVVDAKVSAWRRGQGHTRVLHWDLQ